MNYYTYKVEKVTNDDFPAQSFFAVNEYHINGDYLGTVSEHQHEHDALFNAKYHEMYEKHGDHYLASLATAKWASMNQIRPVQCHGLFYDNATGVVDINDAFRRIWEIL